MQQVFEQSPNPVMSTLKKKRFENIYRPFSNKDSFRSTVLPDVLNSNSFNSRFRSLSSEPEIHSEQNSICTFLTVFFSCSHMSLNSIPKNVFSRKNLRSECFSLSLYCIGIQ